MIQSLLIPLKNWFQNSSEFEVLEIFSKKLGCGVRKPSKKNEVEVL